MLHRVLDDRLQQQRRDPKALQPGGNVESDAQALVEARALDVEVRLDEIHLAAKRRELGLGSEHAAQQRRQPHQRVERAAWRRLNEIADRRERVEEEVRIDLRAQRAQLGFGHQPADFLLAELALVPFARQANRVDAVSGAERKV